MHLFFLINVSSLFVKKDLMVFLTLRIQGKKEREEDVYRRRSVGHLAPLVANALVRLKLMEHTLFRYGPINMLSLKRFGTERREGKGSIHLKKQPISRCPT